MNLESAYTRCEEITTAEAKNFSYGIKLLPPPKRQAMSALYAMARRIDDVGDGDGQPAEKLEELAKIHRLLDSVAQGSPPADDPVAVALADVASHYPLPMSALHELVEGCEMDASGTKYETFEETVGYCRRVAGTVGRLSLAIYGCDDFDRARPLADDLGIALQITNILRDIVEDFDAMGRVYLPAEDLRRFGVDDDVKGPPRAVAALVEFEAARADDYYERGLRLLPMLDWRSRACTAAMAGIYRRLLGTFQADPTAPLRGRASLPGWQKAQVASRALIKGAA